jgi:hypothetical protein
MGKLYRFIATILVLLSVDSACGATTNQFDRFGGFTGIRREASGFFRVEQVDGRWMFITPEGHGYIALGVNHIDVFLENQADAMLQRLGGDRQKLEESLTRSVQDMGFNAGGAYGIKQQQFGTKLPWIASLQYPGGEKFKLDVFDPAWQAKLRETVIRQCRAFADDPFVLGVSFIDIPHYGKFRIHYFRTLPESAPGRKRYDEAKKAGFSDDEFMGLVADTLYAQLKAAVREGAPHHLFFGEKFQLRDAPDAVLKAVGKHVDVFCTQALVRSEHRPPEWQAFQKEGYDHEFQLTGKPMVIVDWSSFFSSGEAFDTPAGPVKPEAEAAEERAKWLADAVAQPYLIGVFRCFLIGLHPNDKMLEGRGRRSCLNDDGTPFPVMTRSVGEANRAVLQQVYNKPK